MAWVKVEQSLLNHRKTMQLGEMLDLDEVYVIGHVVALWLWALDNAPSGILPESDRQIAKACHWDGPPEPFVKALVFAGFLDDDYMGQRTIHDWEEYAGNLIRRREANAKRMREARKKQHQ